MKKEMLKLVAVAIMVMAMMVGMVGCSAPAEEPAPAKEEPAKAEEPAAEEPAEEQDDEIIIGFNQGSNNVDFLRMAGESIAAVCEREGIKFIATESNFDVEQILPNVDNLLTQGADIVIDFNVNAEVGGNLVDYCGEQGVPVMGIDVAYTSPTGEEGYFFGANNQMAGEVCGVGLAEAVKERWDGSIDYLVLFFNSENGDLVRLRLSGMLDGMLAEGIEITEEQIVWIEMGGGGSDTTVAANEKMTDWLAAHPEAEKICVGTVNPETGQGVFSATVASDRSENVMLATNNNGNQTLAAWDSPDAQVWLGGSAYYPAMYGEYIVPYALEIINGETTDKMRTMSHEFLTIDDIDAVKEEMGME